jgi:hypothetical protein
MRFAIGVRWLAVLLGGALGSGVGVATLFVAARVGGPLLSSRVVWWIVTPAAYVVSWLIGWPLEQEAGLACYALAAIAMVALGGGLTGALLAALAAPGSSAPQPRQPSSPHLHSGSGMTRG